MNQLEVYLNQFIFKKSVIFQMFGRLNNLNLIKNRIFIQWTWMIKSSVLPTAESQTESKFSPINCTFSLRNSQLCILSIVYPLNCVPFRNKKTNSSDLPLNSLCNCAWLSFAISSSDFLVFSFGFLVLFSKNTFLVFLVSSSKFVFLFFVLDRSWNNQIDVDRLIDTDRFISESTFLNRHCRSNRGSH